MRTREIGLMIMMFTIILSLCTVTCDAVDESEAVLAITVAEDSMELAYLNVLEVEKAGGEIDELTSKLNDALELLSDGNNAFKSGDFERAVTMSEEVVALSRAIIDDAQIEKIEAERERAVSQRNQLLLSALASVIVIVLGYLSWSMFKARYYRRLTTLKPEVSEVEP